MRPFFRLHALLFAAFLALTATIEATAVPYASTVRNTTENTWEFVLNEAADNVTITRDGGNAIDLGARAAGRHTFDMASFNAFEIAVTDSSAAEWTELSSAANLFTSFERPNGMAVNNIPSDLAFFGTVYVINGATLDTATGRTMGDGVYSMTADLQGVDFANSFAVPTVNDDTQAKAPGWTVNGSQTSAWRIALDAAGNVIATDWSDADGGIKYATKDLSSGGLVLTGEEGPEFGIPHPTIPDAYMHGSIVSKPYTTGTVGQDLVVYALDEDLETSLDEGDGNALWKWNVGSATAYDGVPELFIDPGDLGTDSSGDLYQLDAIGAIAEIHFSETQDRLYLAGARSDGHDSSSLTVVDTSGATPTVLWASKQFSIDHELDGFTDVGTIANSIGINDIFREVWAMDVSNDGTKLYVVMSNLYDAAENSNPYVGPASPNLPGHFLIIPLDENGVPDIQVDDNGTPADPTDDFLANIESIELAGTGNMDRVNIDVDAAGNVYISSNITELLQVFSPGGSTIATTSSAGTFNLMAAPPGGLAGDYNDDGTVNAADYTVWRDNLGTNFVLDNETVTIGMVTEEDYTEWKSNFGSTGGSGTGANANAVPEPTSIAIAALGALALAGIANLRRR